MSDGRDIFDDEVPATTTEDVSPEAPAPQPRDEGGRFAAKDTGEVQAEAPVEAAPPAAVEQDRSGYVPLAVVLDDREKRQRAEREAEQLRAQLAQFQRQQQPQTLPDPIEDANGYGQFLLSQVQQATMANRLQMSRFFAEEKFGAETVAKAMEWYDQQPRAVSEQFLTAPSPFHAAVTHYQSQMQAAERSAPDYEAKLRAKIEAEIRASMAGEVSSPVPPPPTLAAAKGTGRASPSAGGDPLFS